MCVSLITEEKVPGKPEKEKKDEQQPQFETDEMGRNSVTLEGKVGEVLTPRLQVLWLHSY